MWSYGPFGLTYGPLRTSSLGVATRIGVTRFCTAGSVDQRMLKYHSSWVANGPTPRVIGCSGSLSNGGAHIGFTE